MSTYKGRLTRAHGTYVEFAVASGEDVDFGDILVIPGKHSNEKFYIRVYDFKIKSRWCDPSSVSYLLQKVDAQRAGEEVNQKELDFFLGGQHTIKIAMAEQMCYVDERGNLYNPRTCPDFFAEVRSLSAEDLEFLQEIRGDLEIGLLKSGRGMQELTVGIFGERTITEHIGIFGTTGAGKSNLVKVLASSVMQSNKYSMLIFDVHNEYQPSLRMHPLAKLKLSVYNPAPVFAEVKQLTVNAAEILPEDLMTNAFFTEAQTDALYKMESVWRGEWFNRVLELEVKEIIEELEVYTGQKFHHRTISKIKSVCWNLQQELNIDSEGKSEATRQILQDLETRRVVLIELKNVSPLAEQAISAFLAKKVLKHHEMKMDQNVSSLTPVLVVIEEAHRFLGRKEHGNANVFARLVSEARKFNLGLCAVDQQPRLLADRVLSQLNTLFILGIASKADRAKLEAMARKDLLQQRNEIKNLERGELIIASNYLRFAAPVKVHKFEDYVAKVTKEL